MTKRIFLLSLCSLYFILIKVQAEPSIDEDVEFNGIGNIDDNNSANPSTIQECHSTGIELSNKEQKAIRKLIARTSQYKKPLVVFVVGDHEYSSEITMPLLAKALESDYNFRVKILKAFPDHNAEENIPGLEILEEADLAVFYLRWRRLPAGQMSHIESYLKSGKPLLGFRTTTHAFNYPAGHALEKWNAFGELAFNAPPGWGQGGHTHYGHESTTEVSVIPQAADHPILEGVSHQFHVKSWLYTVLPDYPLDGSTWLLMGKSVDPNDPEAIDHPVAWIGQNAYGGNFFMTTLGHPEDFAVKNMQRLILNAVHWILDLPVPRKMRKKMNIAVPYGTHETTNR